MIIPNLLVKTTLCVSMVLMLLGVSPSHAAAIDDGFKLKQNGLRNDKNLRSDKKANLRKDNPKNMRSDKNSNLRKDRNR
jgi:hypothetical protein